MVVLLAQLFNVIIQHNGLDLETYTNIADEVKMVKQQVLLTY